MMTSSSIARTLPDLPPADGRALRVTYLGHATTRIDLDGINLLTDPVLRHRTAHLRRICGLSRGFAEIEPDVILISHMHWDHLDLPTLRKMPADTLVAGPRGSAEVLQRAGLGNVVELGVGEKVTIGRVVVEATPANHDGGRPPFGPAGEAIGFLVQGSSTVYFAGDTDLFDEMSSLTNQLDLALLPVWGWGPSLGPGHLNPERAAESLLRLRPRIAMPIHWGTLCPIGINWLRPQFLVRPPHEFARFAGELIPEVGVRIVDPGGHLELRRTLA